MKCNHDHECEQCVREQIAVKEAELTALRKKLPAPRIVYLNRPDNIQYVPCVPPTLIRTVPVPMPLMNPFFATTQAGLGMVAGTSNSYNMKNV